VRVTKVPHGVSGMDLEFHKMQGKLCSCGRKTKLVLRPLDGQRARLCTGCDRPIEDCPCQ
jgi:hypothetical protein